MGEVSIYGETGFPISPYYIANISSSCKVYLKKLCASNNVIFIVYYMFKSTPYVQNATKSIILICLCSSLQITGQILFAV